MKKAKKTVLVVQSGQYEMTACRVVVRHKTEAGLMRRARQLSREHAVYGDNWSGWINADVAIAHPNDTYFANEICGGQHCHPVNGWLDLEV